MKKIDECIGLLKIRIPHSAFRIPHSAFFSLQLCFSREPPPGKLNYCQTNLATRALNLRAFPQSGDVNV
jgi:hypothetical protein